MDKVTINDVAKVAGVSRQTVSRVLNESPKVKDGTREKIKKVIKKLNYYPNSAAQNFSRSNPNIIGFYTPFSEEKASHIPFYSELYAIISKKCLEKDFQFHIFSNHEGENIVNSLVQFFKEKKLGGLLLTCPSISMEGLLKLKNAGIPLVVMGRPSQEVKIPYVDHNIKEMAYQATKHLIHNGYKKITLINGPDFMTYSKDNLIGYKNALNNHNIKFISELVLEGDLTQASGYHLMNELIKNEIEFDSVFVVNDMMTLGVFEAMRQNGYSIPGDYSLISGSIDGIKHMVPKITGFHHGYNKEYGQIATNMLIKLMKGMKLNQEKVILECDFYNGDTT